MAGQLHEALLAVEVEHAIFFSDQWPGHKQREQEGIFHPMHRGEYT